MKVSTWRGGTLGIRIKKSDRLKFFKKGVVAVQVTAGNQTQTYILSPSFWKGCSELRGGVIKDYLTQKGLHSWPTGNPHILDLIPNGLNSFDLI